MDMSIHISQQKETEEVQVSWEGKWQAQHTCEGLHAILAVHGAGCARRRSAIFF